jgi:hypothetical protein
MGRLPFAPRISKFTSIINVRREKMRQQPQPKKSQKKHHKVPSQGKIEKNTNDKQNAWKSFWDRYCQM